MHQRGLDNLGTSSTFGVLHRDEPPARRFPVAYHFNRAEYVDEGKRACWPKVTNLSNSRALSVSETAGISRFERQSDITPAFRAKTEPPALTPLSSLSDWGNKETNIIRETCAHPSPPAASPRCCFEWSSGTLNVMWRFDLEGSPGHQSRLRIIRCAKRVASHGSSVPLTVRSSINTRDSPESHPSGSSYTARCSLCPTEGPCFQRWTISWARAVSPVKRREQRRSELRTLPGFLIVNAFVKVALG